MFLPTILAILAYTATAQYPPPIMALPPKDGNSKKVSPKIGGIIFGCIFGFLFLLCLCEAIWRKRTLRREAERQPDPEQDVEMMSIVFTAENKNKESKDSGDTDIQDSVSIATIDPPPPAYTPKMRSFTNSQADN
ncbi:hypothetical protein DFS33DRAFT_1456830 [Desarmillaria ectypa]|nr:hypothetical protein DFS33DRAFT_1456830 [Desarmillaria ectypa]